MLPKEKLPSLFIRSGLAFVFIYAAISMSISPQSYLHYVPSIISQIIPSEVFLRVHAVFEVLLSGWLLWGKKLFYSSLIATVALFLITFLNLDSFNIVFRNVGIITGGMALVVMSWPNKKQIIQQQVLPTVQAAPPVPTPPVVPTPLMPPLPNPVPPNLVPNPPAPIAAVAQQNPNPSHQ